MITAYQQLDLLRGNFLKKQLINRGRFKNKLSQYFAKKLRSDLDKLYSQKLVLPRNRKISHIPISLTSWTPRIKCLPLTLLTLLNQTVIPQNIYVWISHEDKKNFEEIGELFKPYGVVFQYVENLGPHKKWYPMLKKTTYDSFVICDDDTFYPPTWFDRLVTAKNDKKEPVVVAHRCHEIVSKDNIIMPYKEWNQDLINAYKGSFKLFPTGCGGVLLPREMFTEEFLSLDLIKKLCPRADDIWLKFASLNSRIKTVKTNYDFIPIEENSSEVSSLMNTNVNQNQNDTQIQNVLAHFQLEI